MKQFFYLSAFSILALASCTSGFKKAGDGIEYKIIADGSGKKVEYGNFLQMHIVQLFKGANKDTVLNDSREIMPRIEPFDSNSYPKAYFNVFKELRKGDSLVLRLPTDSVFKYNPDQMPPFMKGGGHLYTTIKVVNIFTTPAQADSAYQAEMKIAKPKIIKKQKEEVDRQLVKNKQQIEFDGKLISEYLAKNNIKAVKGEWGTYVAIQEEGTGNKIDEKSIVSVNYTGRTLDSGKVFDSNINPKGQPYQVNIGEVGGVILGWTDGLKQLKNGAKATFYIPSSLGYGVAGNPRAGIKPNDCLVFDIQIVDVTDAATFEAQAAEIRKKLEEAQKIKPEDQTKNPELKK